MTLASTSALRRPSTGSPRRRQSSKTLDDAPYNASIDSGEATRRSFFRQRSSRRGRHIPGIKSGDRDVWRLKAGVHVQEQVVGSQPQAVPIGLHDPVEVPDIHVVIPFLAALFSHDHDIAGRTAEVFARIANL